MESIEGALEAAKGMSGEFTADWALHFIAEAQATAGDNRGALATARRAAGTSGVDGVLSDICDAQCRENNVAEAIATARDMESAKAQSEALVRIALSRVQAGDPGGAAQPIGLAVEAARKVADNLERAQALAGIAEMQLNAITGRRTE